MKYLWSYLHSTLPREAVRGTMEGHVEAGMSQRCKGRALTEHQGGNTVSAGLQTRHRCSLTGGGGRGLILGHVWEWDEHLVTQASIWPTVDTYSMFSISQNMIILRLRRWSSASRTPLTLAPRCWLIPFFKPKPGPATLAQKSRSIDEHLDSNLPQANFFQSFVSSKR